MTGDKPGPYRVVENRLCFRGEDLLGGPLLQLEMMAAVLNAAKPRDVDLGPTLRALIGMTRGCKFLMGERLLGLGMPLSFSTPQKIRSPHE